MCSKCAHTTCSCCVALRLPFCKLRVHAVYAVTPSGSFVLVKKNPWLLHFRGRGTSPSHSHTPPAQSCNHQAQAPHPQFREVIYAPVMHRRQRPAKKDSRLTTHFECCRLVCECCQLIAPTWTMNHASGSPGVSCTQTGLVCTQVGVYYLPGWSTRSGTSLRSGLSPLTPSSFPTLMGLSISFPMCSCESSEGNFSLQDGCRSPPGASLGLLSLLKRGFPEMRLRLAVLICLPEASKGSQLNSSSLLQGESRHGQGKFLEIKNNQCTLIHTTILGFNSYMILLTRGEKGGGWGSCPFLPPQPPNQYRQTVPMFLNRCISF